MVKLEEYKIGDTVIKIFHKLPYRLECRLEELIIKMAEGMEGKLSDFEDIDFDDMEFSTMKGFEISKKIDVNNFLLMNAIVEPEICQGDLNDDDHPLNDQFKEIGDYLFNKYMEQYSEKVSVKKKPTILQD